MQSSPLTSTLLFHIGPVAITRPVVTTWAIMAALAIICHLVTRRLSMLPGERQAVLEGIVTGIANQIEDVVRKEARPFLPLVGTLFIFLVVANLSGFCRALRRRPARSRRRQPSRSLFSSRYIILGFAPGA